MARARYGCTAAAFFAAVGLLFGCASTSIDDGTDQPAPKVPAVWLGTSLHTEEFPATISTNGASGGARIEFMPAASPAKSAGLEEGDIIIAVDGRPTATAEDVTRSIAAVPAPKSVPVTVIRAGHAVTVPVHLQSRPADATRQFLSALAERIAAEQAVAEERERANDSGRAFAHYVKSARLLSDQRRYGAQVDQSLDNDLLHMRTLLPALERRPAIPAEADRHNQRAIALLRGASKDGDNYRAAQEFAEAIYEAPWIADLYLNLGLVDEKTGEVEDAMRAFKRYLLLNPAARDAGTVKDKIVRLELLADERRPWLPYLSVYNGADGGVSRISLRGRQLFISVVKPAPSPNHNYKPGDTLFYGTISGSDVTGKWVMQRKDSLLVKCLGTTSQYDAKGHAGPDMLVIQAFTNVRFNTFTCEITSHEWQVAGRYPATVKQASTQ